MQYVLYQMVGLLYLQRRALGIRAVSERPARRESHVAC